MIQRLKKNLERRRDPALQDRGEIVSNVLWLAGFVIVATAIVVWIGTAVLGKTADTAACVTGADAYGQSINNSASNCSGTNAANAENAVQNDAEYQNYDNSGS